MIKLLNLKWVWFRHTFNGQGPMSYLGLMVLDRWVLAYYKGGVAVWGVKTLLTQPIDSWDHKSHCVVGTYITKL